MRFKSVLSALGIACALIIGFDYVSFAATGQSALLGKVNKANKATTFERTTSGPAVSFVTKAGKQPFSVNRQAKVVNLNVDKLDGLDSTRFAANNVTKVYKYTAATPATAHTFNIPIPSAGKYLVTYDVPLSLAGTSVQAEWAYCEIGQGDSPIFGTYQGSGHTSTASVPGTGPSSGPSMGLSATTVIDPAGFGYSFNVFCNASANWTTPPLFAFFGTTLAKPAIVTVTKIGNSSTTNINARQAPKAQAERQAVRAR